MSTENSNPNGVKVLRGDATDGPLLPVYIEFEEGPVECGSKHEILRVFVGPGPGLDLGLVDQYRTKNRFVKAMDFVPLGSCDNGKASVIFVKDDGMGNAVAEYEFNDSLVGITAIASRGRKFPETLIFAETFYKFGKVNRKAFAKLFF